MWRSLLGLIKKTPWQVWALLGGALSFWLYGNYREAQGRAEVQAEWDQAIERGKVLVAELERKANEVNEVIVEKVVTKTEVIRGNTEYIIKEVPVYIPAGTPDLPAGFRVLHDAAALSQLPGETSTSGEPVGVEDASRTIATNYETCHLWKAEVDAWNEWWEEQSLVWQTAQRR